MLVNEIIFDKNFLLLHKMIAEESIIILSNLIVQKPQSSLGPLTATRGNAVLFDL